MSLNNRQKKAIEYLKINKKITNKKYCVICKVDRVTAFRDLKSLEKNGILKKQGGGRSLYYVFNEANNEIR